MASYSPERCHEPALDRPPRQLAFHPGADLQAWRSKLARALSAAMGKMPARGPLRLREEWEKEHADYFEKRLVFQSEPEVAVPCHLLLPKRGAGPFPLIICLQGHSSGMHISLGRALYEGDEASIAGGRDIALQAVAQGYAALALEQRCFGERKDARKPEVRSFKHTCQHATMVALLLGRTMIGQRVWDVSRAIDAMETYPEIDHERIACMGNSGGGTITYYSACWEPRLAAAMPSCSVCTYAASIGRIDHCADNYLPGALQHFEMADLAGLIAPRPLIVVAGKDDGIFPLPGVQQAFATIKQVYQAMGAINRCALVIGEGGHRFYPDQAWPAFKRITGW